MNTALHSSTVPAPLRPDGWLAGTPGRRAALVAAYVAGYVLLDWVSSLYPLEPFSITPWNPPPGLSLALLMLLGLRYAPAVLLAAFAAEVMVRSGLSHPVPTLEASLVITIGYTGIAALLRGPLHVAPALPTLRDLAWLFGIVAAGVVGIALLYVGIFTQAGLIPREGFFRRVLEFWVGDVIGAVITAPLLLMLAVHRLRLPGAPIAAEAFAHGCFITLVLLFVFRLGAPNEAKFFYLLFLPLIWISMRHGFEGATLGLAVVQIGLILSVQWGGYTAASVLEFQLLMLALAATGLFLGMAVTERRRTEERLRERQFDLNRTLKLAAAGEMVSSLAHELNQPLAAAQNYARACALMLEQELAVGGARHTQLAGTLSKVVREVSRAGQVVHRLREFFRSGSLELEIVRVEDIVKTALEPNLSRIERQHIAPRIDIPPGLPAVLVDRVQTEIVLHNLIANAIDSIAAELPELRQIRVVAELTGRSHVKVSICDSGPGVASDMVEQIFQPFVTSKPEGMGLGLAVSRSIIEAQGGRLWSEHFAGGGVFCFTLPLPETVED